MMKPLPKLPEHVVGVSASGQIDAKDYETAKHREKCCVVFTLALPLNRGLTQVFES